MQQQLHFQKLTGTFSFAKTRSEIQKLLYDIIENLLASDGRSITSTSTHSMAVPGATVPAVPVQDPVVLLDFSQPLNVPLLETTVALMYGSGSGEQVSSDKSTVQDACLCITKRWNACCSHERVSLPHRVQKYTRACTITLVDFSLCAPSHAQG